MTETLRLKRPQLLTDLACERIREAIVGGEFKLGEQMSEAQLAQRLGVSKTPVREALLRLKGDGLVEIHPQRGSFVFSLTPAQVTPRWPSTSRSRSRRRRSSQGASRGS